MINSRRRPDSMTAAVAATGDTETLTVEIIGAILSVHEQLTANGGAEDFCRLVRAIVTDLERGDRDDSKRDNTNHGNSAGSVPPILRPKN